MFHLHLFIVFPTLKLQNLNTPLDCQTKFHVHFSNAYLVCVCMCEQKRPSTRHKFYARRVETSLAFSSQRQQFSCDLQAVTNLRQQKSLLTTLQKRFFLMWYLIYLVLLSSSTLFAEDETRENVFYNSLSFLFTFLRFLIFLKKPQESFPFIYPSRNWLEIEPITLFLSVYALRFSLIQNYKLSRQGI